MEEHNPEGFSLPLVIGVTGHRDLRPEDLPKLENLVRQIIETFKSDFPHTPLILLSALAEGADRLVARVGLESGALLVVPLPMRRDIYEADFSTTESRSEFENLLGQASHWFELPPLQGITEAAIKEHGAARDRQYEQVGAYIVRHSQLLIALWDGVTLDLVGGTSRVVKFQLEGVPEPYAPVVSPIDIPESGPVYHVVTPRAGHAMPQDKPFSLHKLFPGGYVGEQDRFRRTCARLDAFNSDVIMQAGLLAQELHKSEEYLFPEIETTRLSKSAHTMRTRFAIMDTLAIGFQKRTRSTLRILFIFILLAAICFDLFAHFFSHQYWILGIYLALLAGAYFWINRRANKRDYQNKYQDYRAFAEGLRVQFFWDMAGCDLSVADNYLRRQRSELTWICNGIRAWTIAAKAEESLLNRGVKQTFELNLVLQHWVIDQAKYFARAAQREHRSLERAEPCAKVLLRIGVGVTVLGTAALLFPHPWREKVIEALEHHHDWHALLLALMSLPAIGAALLHGYIGKRAWAEHAKQYSRMSILFANAQERLSDLVAKERHTQAKNLLEELGKAALEENGDWVLLHRERPLEVPHAG